MNFNQCDNQAEAVVKASTALNKLLSLYRGEPVLFLCCGGSSLLLLNTIDIRNFSNKVTMTVLDERFTIDNANSVFHQLMHIPFYWPAKDKGAVFIDTQSQENEDINALSDRMENALRGWRKQNPKGKIIITQGVGPDAHTAGLLPYPEEPVKFNKLFIETDRWVVGYDATGKDNEYPLRVTVTVPFLSKEVEHSIAFMTGEEKKEAFRALVAPDGNLANTPARVMLQMHDVQFFTDITLKIR